MKYSEVGVALEKMFTSIFFLAVLACELCNVWYVLGPLKILKMRMWTNSVVNTGKLKNQKCSAFSHLTVS